ncbi:MAG TPA: RNA polymerase sigma factor [Candidatus Choladousia intestinavium]|uniref:RNA polymerase sigma factor n=1 Tax=Candidatus Choladousia intestinavium TaxID=2840727 RepID=A0A9D1D9G0_9FIRM|nr:RNA polymerase sigma factor [Candidatus Choladousia intestinavium]
MEHLTELVGQAKNGSAHAFALLYKEIYQDLYRFAFYTLRHPQDAEDAVSEAVTDAFSQIRSLKEAAAFKAWMFRILTAKCRRKLKQYVDKTEELEETIPGKSRDWNEDLDVRQAFFSLSQEERLILSLNLFAGYTSQEIGGLLKLPSGTVRSKQSRALRKMEQQLS